MPRIAGVRERRHQPIYDTLFRFTGVAPVTPLQPRTVLFGSRNFGNLALTNLQTAGQLASDQTYVTLALRCHLFFEGTNALVKYQNTAEQLYFTFILGDKPQFQCFAWYFPAGGGLYGSDGTTPVYSNGYPSGGAIMKLARPIIVPVRQNVQVIAEFFPVGTTNALDLLNNGAADDQNVCSFFLDGLQTRDVQ